ncbi:MAG: DUF3040 domain-containing protein, partial [Mycobacterium sp.]|nr:DUF3040 domain-containing protein [Mycobacterium sp.]
SFRSPTTRRRIQGVAVLAIGLTMLVSGVAVEATMIASFPILSVFGFLVMFGGAVFAITGPHIAGTADRSGSAGSSQHRRAKGTRGSSTSRIEDRFWRHFDE